MTVRILGAQPLKLRKVFLHLLLLLRFACHLVDDGRKPMSELCIALCTAGNFCGERIIERPRIFLRRERNLLQ